MRHLHLRPWVGSLVLLGGVVIAHFLAVPYLPSHVLFVGGVAIVAYTHGWRAAAVALLVPPISLGLSPRIPAGHILAPTIECALAAIVMLIARNRLMALTHSHSKLRALLASIEDVILVVDKDGTYCEVVPTNPALLYRPREEVLGKRIHDVFPREQADFFVHHIRLALDERRTIPVDYRLKIGDRELWFSASVSPINGGRQVVWVARDITARKQAEQDLQASHASLEERVAQRTRELTATVADLHGEIERRSEIEHALRRSERMLAEAQEVGRIGSWELDLADNDLWWSDEQYRLFGLTPETAPAGCDRFLMSLTDESHARFDHDVAALYEKGEHEWSWKIATREGEKELRCRGRVIRDKHGEPTRLVGISMDVTHSRRTKEALRLSEERFRLLAHASNDAVWDCDLLSGRIWRDEDAFSRMFGEGAACPDVKSWIALIHPADCDRVVASREEAIHAGQESWSSEYRFQRAGGSWATILDRACIVRDASKRPVRMVGEMMDLTERRQLEAQLQQTQRVNSLGRVAASIAHEFNNVLMAIQPNIELVQRLAPPGGRFRHVAENVTRAVKRGKSITNEILRFTRRCEPALQNVEVKDFMDRWQEDVCPLVEPRVEMIMNLPAESLYMSADPSQFGQVLTDLAVNARDAMLKGGRLNISVEAARSDSRYHFGLVPSPDRFLHFTVSDEGCGIAAENLPHIFEPLFTTKNGGIGLGLAICYQIVDQHRGHIFVESELGRGTSFHIFVPATLPVDEVLPQRVDTLLDATRVLLVEDEAVIADGLKMLLEIEGAAVEVASLGSEALPAIEEFGPHVVVLDIGLPDIDGVEIYHRIESRWPHLPVIFSSGHADAARLEKIIAQPHIAFIAKPYEFQTVRDIIGSLLQKTAA